MTLPCTGHKNRPARGGGDGGAPSGCVDTGASGVTAISGLPGGGAGNGAGGAPSGCVDTGASGVTAISGLPGGGAGNGAGGARGRVTAGGNFNTRPGSTAKGGVSSFIRANE